ncbi:sensor domain-containing diguanylate cyclase [Leptospira yasudae]|uniref:diguanylate cyclase n=1 Tax=Leptospira yasudae TaxID=2202201 RepID=A0ABX9LYZ8_9LEPT|nr:sensor domain-containing diguanylate cyclase [Leptospira yasudae]RHX77816.1 diguanylate cyclase [Leptospira yasudae]TGK26841.1 sensor domain-containing diguanylate cyclase [Leptospira yasudae]TGM04762.1 sensor domain-containing diguanylate cyclase [Leptospira yasudae]
MNQKNKPDYEKFFQNSIDLQSIQNLEGVVVDINSSFTTSLGWSKEELIGQTPFHLVHPDDLPSLLEEFQKLREDLPIAAGIQNRILCSDGKYKQFSWTAFSDFESGFVYVTGRDITELIESNRKISQLAEELKAANDRLFEQASTDPLTKLKNRRFFNEEINYLLRLARRQETPISLVMIDVDHFKQYNDTFGHPAGDRVLTDLASILIKTLRTSDLVARYGGEEFIAAMPNTTMEQAIEIMDRLSFAVREFPWEKRNVTISVGISTIRLTANDSEYEKSFKLLLENADRALYISKRNGRDRITHSSKHSNVS